MVPLVLYFIIMWTFAFWWLYRLVRRYDRRRNFSYETAVVQSFTAGSNNFVRCIRAMIYRGRADSHAGTRDRCRYRPLWC